MDQEPLFIEDWREAVRHTAARVGGAKELGHALWPNKSPDEAARWLADCLNPDRPAKLDPDELLRIIRIGREHGSHILMSHIAESCGYTRPSPVEPEDQRDALYRQFVESTKNLEGITNALRRLGVQI